MVTKTRIGNLNGTAVTSKRVMGPECRRETITPEMARRLLEKNPETNRRVIQSKVDRLADDIRSGRWTVTHQGIAIDWDGNVLDGQHRLWAIVEADMAVECNVWYDCDPATFDKIDTGTSKSGADFVTMRTGRKADAKRLAAFGRSILDGLGGSHSDASMVAKFVAKYVDMLARVNSAFDNAVGFTVPVGAAFAKAAFTHDVDTVVTLAKRYASQEWASPTDPLKALHMLFQRIRESHRNGNGVRGRLGPKDTYAYAVAAVRAALEGRPIVKSQQTSIDFPMPADWEG